MASDHQVALAVIGGVIGLSVTRRARPSRLAGAGAPQNGGGVTGLPAACWPHTASWPARTVVAARPQSLRLWREGAFSGWAGNWSPRTESLVVAVDRADVADLRTVWTGCPRGRPVIWESAARERRTPTGARHPARTGRHQTWRRQPLCSERAVP